MSTNKEQHLLQNQVFNDTEQIQRNDNPGRKETEEEPNQSRKERFIQVFMEKLNEFNSLPDKEMQNRLDNIPKIIDANAASLHHKLNRENKMKAEIEEVIMEDKELKKYKNQYLTLDKIKIEREWKVMSYFDIRMNQLSPTEFKEWFSELHENAIDYLRGYGGISLADVFRLYQRSIRTGLLTLPTTLKYGLSENFLLEYGENFSLLHQLLTPKNTEDFRYTQFLCLCMNQPNTEKRPKYPVLIMKTMTKSVEAEINIIKTYLLNLAHRFLDNECFVLLEDDKRVIFLRYDDSGICKLWVSEEYKEDLIEEFGNYYKTGKLTEDTENVYKIVFCILSHSMEKCNKFLKSRNLL